MYIFKQTFILVSENVRVNVTEIHSKKGIRYIMHVILIFAITVSDKTTVQGKVIKILCIGLLVGNTQK